MKTWEKILYWCFVIGWLIAPMIVNDILYSRNVILPDDLATNGIVIWYAIGAVQSWWFNRNKPNYPNRGNGPSYTDKGQNDWMNRD